MSRHKLNLIASLLAGTLVFAACAGSSTPGTTDTDDTPGLVGESTFDVTLTDQAVVLDDATAEAFLGATDDQSELRFKGSAAAAKALKPGQVVVVPGELGRKVASVRESNGEIVVATTEATLGEIVKTGTVSWKKQILWNELPQETYTSAVDPLLGLVATVDGRVPDRLAPLSAPSGMNFEGKVQGFDVKYTLSPTPDRLNMTLVASKSVGGKKVMAVSGTGYINNFTQETILTYEQSTPERMVARTTGLEGEMELKWAAFRFGTQDLTEVTSFQLPVELPIRFAVGPIPVKLGIKAVLQVVPELSVPQSSSGGSFKVRYNSEQGFAIENELSNPVGKLEKADIGVSGETVTAGDGPAGFGLGVEFPRLELAILGPTAVAFITVKTYSKGLWTPGTLLTSDIPPCQMGGTTLTAVTGYKLSLLGFVSVEDTKELWKQDYSKYKDDKPCTLDGSAPKG
jgi:hypothetical protein